MSCLIKKCEARRGKKSQKHTIREKESIAHVSFVLLSTILRNGASVRFGLSLFVDTHPIHIGLAWPGEASHICHTFILRSAAAVAAVAQTVCDSVAMKGHSIAVIVVSVFALRSNYH